MISYVFLSVLVFCSCQVFSAELPDSSFDKDSLKCMEDLKVDKKFLQDQFDDGFHLPKGNAKLNELFECVVKAKDGFDDNGKINKKVLHTDIVNVLLPSLKKSGDLDEIANKIIAECEETKGDNLADRVVNLHNCLVDAVSKL